MNSAYNPRITKKDINLIKAALRRAFTRSELRNQVIKEAIVIHSDPNRPKVKTWCLCSICWKPEAKSYCIVDHVIPLVPIGVSFEDMSLKDAVDRLWCEKSNLQVLDKVCHNIKSKQEAKLRREYKKRNKK